MKKRAQEEINDFIDLKQILFISCWGIILGLEIFRNFQQLFKINLVYYFILERQSGIYEFIQSTIIGTGIILLLYILYVKFAKTEDFAAGKFNRACVPLLLLLVEALFHVNILSPICFTMISGIILFRYLSLFTYKEGIYKFPYKYLAPIILFISFFAFSFYGYYLQRHALMGMEFIWGDWGFTLGPLLNTLDGNWFYSNYHGFSHFEIHFAPGLLLLGPVVWFFKSVDLFFFMSSVFLFSTGVVLYFLARQLKMSQFESLIVAFIAFTVPGITNMNLAIFYGFHEVYPVIPLVLLSFLFYEKKNYSLAILMYILSLSFKETVPVLWLGFGMVFILRKKYKPALFLIIFSLAYYLLVNEIIFPWLRDGQEYFNLFRFKHLGSTTSEIVLSPFARPAVFLNSLFRPGCLLFIWLLLLPFVIVIPRNILWSCASGVILMFVCLQSSDEVQNIMVQYQAMPLAAILLNMVYNLHDQKLCKKDTNFWAGSLLYGLRDRQNGNTFSATLLGTLCICMICLLFFTENHFSKNTPLSFKDNTNCTIAINEFKTLIPAGVPVTVSMRTAPHLTFRNTLDFELEPEKWHDYVFFVLNDTLWCKSMGQLRDKLHQSKDYHLVKGLWVGRHYLQLYQRNPLNPMKTEPLIKISSEKWNSLEAYNIKNNDDNVQLKIKPEASKNRIRIYLRLVEAVKYDIELNLTVSDGKQSIVLRKMFNNGISSAAVANKGDVFSCYISLPDNFGSIITARANIFKFFP